MRTLDGIVVVSLADHYPGPFASMLLSDWGAEVINVERPGGDPARAFPAFHAALARGKHSIVLDLKDSTAYLAFRELVRGADVVLEGYRPGVARRLGVDHESLRAIRPDLVYVSVSGFGQDGPYRDLPAHDLNVQALAGVLAIDPNVATASSPHPPRLAIADLAAGHSAAHAVLLGLLRRARDGQGTYTDVSMFDAVMTLLTTELAPLLEQEAGAGLEHEAGYGIFTCADGRSVSIGIANEDHFWSVLVDETGLDPALRVLPAEERIKRRVELQRLMASRFAQAPCRTWVERLSKRGLPVSTLQSLEEAITDPQVGAREMTVAPNGESTRYVRQPLNIDGQSWGPRCGAVPARGADTREVLEATGLASEVVDELVWRAAGTSSDPPASTSARTKNQSSGPMKE